ncbi:MAG: DUF4256 domain-containing protein [Gemmatimonadales bacterium]|nr:DUF4256 domain-containing protein [Gemmatimonadales bacterium]
MPKAKSLAANQQDSLLGTLQARFDAHMHRHAGLDWTMERSGGEPDVVGVGACTFVDCSAQSPKGRRSVCYDREALNARKEHKPKSSAVHMATAMGAALLTVDEYRALQELGEFDTTTSSWVQTPVAMRQLGGALFCDRRYDTIFVYHNGAESYYAARGFRCSLKV